MGTDSTEDFGAWVTYVCEHIDERCGFEVDVDTRGDRDVQSDIIDGGTDAQREIITEAKTAMWDAWCSAGAP